MPIIYSGQVDSYYHPPKFGTGFSKKKTLAFNSLYSGGSWRDFGNVIGSGSKENKKQEFIAQQKQQDALDKIIKNTATTGRKASRTKEDIIGTMHGSGFKVC